MDVAVGDELPEWVIEGVDAEKMKTMAAILDDSNPIHFDADSVRRIGMGDRVVNQGPTNMAYVMNMLIAWTGDPVCLRRLTVRFQANVLAGDGVSAGGLVTAVEEDADGRVAHCEIWLRLADGSPALHGSAAVVVG